MTFQESISEEMFLVFACLLFYLGKKSIIRLFKNINNKATEVKNKRKKYLIIENMSEDKSF